MQLQVNKPSSLTLPLATAAPIVHPGWFAVDDIERTQPSTGEETTRFAAFMQLIQTAGALDRAASDILADLGLTAGAFGALLELASASPVGLAPSELARRLAVARRTATLYIDTLARQGWAERHDHPDDRRMVLATVTREGFRIVNELGPAYEGRLASLLDGLAPIQAERLRQLLILVKVGS